VYVGGWATIPDHPLAASLGRCATMSIPTNPSWPPFRAPRGKELSCAGWHQEAALRMLLNNLDPEVAERPDDLVVYGGSGKAARDRPSLERIVATLRRLSDQETLLVQ